MKKIVIATDGSPSAFQAIEFGIELAAGAGRGADVRPRRARAPRCFRSPASRWAP